MTKERGSNPSNTLILTDPTLLHPENESPLRETLDAVKAFVKRLNIEHTVHSCLQILHFKSFRRIIMIFSNVKFAELVHKYFTQLKIKIGYARKGNTLTGCDLDTGCKAPAEAAIDTKLNPDDTPESSPIDDKFPGGSVFSDQTYSNRLEPPNPPVQMQSPPASPYEGWISRPEDPPSNTTIGFHPKTISHILYTYDNKGDADFPINKHDEGLEDPKMKKVFSSFIDSELPDTPKSNELCDLDIGPGLEEDDDNNKKEFHGSLFQQQLTRPESQKEQGAVPSLKIPIVIVDSQEAENLRQHASNLTHGSTL